MPADKTPPTTETVIDPRDARIAELEQQLTDTKNDLAGFEKMLASEQKKLKKLEASAKVDLPENVVILPGGKQLKIVKTVIAKFALDEVKKGFIEEDLELIVPERG